LSGAQNGIAQDVAIRLVFALDGQWDIDQLMLTGLNLRVHGLALQ
jgi:hypothetical protein